MTRQEGLVEALEVKARVFSALAIRYVVTRYGRENLGFAWLLVEPMILCLGVMGLWTLKYGSMQHGLLITGIVFTGYMPLTLWRHMSNSTAYLLRYSKQFFHFSMIKPLDALLSRLLLEFTSVTAAALLVYLILTEFEVLPRAYDWQMMLQGWLLMGALGLGWGLTVGTLTEISEVVEKFLQPVQYLLLPISGCFFMMTWMPDEAREILAFVPLVHAYETIRGGLFGPSVLTYGDPAYGFAWAVIGVACGLLILEKVQHNIKP